MVEQGVVVNVRVVQLDQWLTIQGQIENGWGWLVLDVITIDHYWTIERVMDEAREYLGQIVKPQELVWASNFLWPGEGVVVQY